MNNIDNSNNSNDNNINNNDHDTNNHNSLIPINNVFYIMFERIYTVYFLGIW